MSKSTIYKSTITLFILIVTFLSFSYLSGKDINSFEASTTPEIQTEDPQEIIPEPSKEGYLPYIEIIDACGPSAVGSCVNMRTGPGEEYEVAARLRNGIVLPVEKIILVKGREWYKIKVDEDIQFPERAKDGWYIASGDYIKLFEDIGTKEISLKTHATTTKRIVVDLSEQMIYAYDEEKLFMKEPISAGLKDTPTPRGTFTIFKKTPSRYMQGPIEGVSDQYYDLPGVPWDLYFTAEGAVIHGTYWHDHFGEPWSHGCVNISPQIAKKLYEWSVLGMPVIVQN